MLPNEPKPEHACKECGGYAGGPDYNLQVVAVQNLGDHGREVMLDAGMFCSAACLVAYLTPESETE